MLEAPPSGPHHLPEVAEAPLLTPSSEFGAAVQPAAPRRPCALRFPASPFFLLLEARIPGQSWNPRVKGTCFQWDQETRGLGGRCVSAAGGLDLRPRPHTGFLRGTEQGLWGRAGDEESMDAPSTQCGGMSQLMGSAGEQCQAAQNPGGAGDSVAILTGSPQREAGVRRKMKHASLSPAPGQMDDGPQPPRHSRLGRSRRSSLRL